jgi:hypothetical protein
MMHRSLLRSIISAIAPAGNVNRKKGKVATVDIREIRRGEAVSVFITHVAAMSCAESALLETRPANQSDRKTGLRSGSNIEVRAAMFFAEFFRDLKNMSNHLFATPDQQDALCGCRLPGFHDLVSPTGVVKPLLWVGKSDSNPISPEK